MQDDCRVGAHREGPERVEGHSHGFGGEESGMQGKDEHKKRRKEVIMTGAMWPCGCTFAAQTRAGLVNLYHFH